jgi:hypothetical protein
MKKREREKQWKPTKSWRVLTEDSHLQQNREGRSQRKESRETKYNREGKGG